jgi:hypothetical protein
MSSFAYNRTQYVEAGIERLTSLLNKRMIHSRKHSTFR